MFFEVLCDENVTAEKRAAVDEIVAANRSGENIDDEERFEAKLRKVVKQKPKGDAGKDDK